MDIWVQRSRFEFFHWEGNKLFVQNLCSGESKDHLIFASDIFRGTKKAIYSILMLEYEAGDCFRWEDFKISSFLRWGWRKCCEESKVVFVQYVEVTVPSNMVEKD